MKFLLKRAMFMGFPAVKRHPNIDGQEAITRALHGKLKEGEE